MELSLGLIALYFVPTIIAVARSHGNAVPIFLTNLLLGWTAIGWVIALIWSFTNNTAGRATGAAMEPRGWVKRSLGRADDA